MLSTLFETISNDLDWQIYKAIIVQSGFVKNPLFISLFVNSSLPLIMSSGTMCLMIPEAYLLAMLLNVLPTMVLTEIRMW